MSDDIIDISPNKDVDTPDDDGPFEAGSDQRFRLDLDPEAIDETLRELGSRMRKQFDRHRHSKVRLTYKGKPLIADIPIAVFISSEAASFWWMGPLRVLLVNLGAAPSSRSSSSTPPTISWPRATRSTWTPRSRRPRSSTARRS